MSDWIRIEDKENIQISEDGETVDVLYKTDDFGNCYLEIPIEWLIELLKDKI